MSKILSLLAFTLIVGISGCSVQPTQPVAPIDNWQAHAQRLQLLAQWQLDAKLGYRDGTTGGSAWLEWQQQQDQFEVRLSGPFGAGATLIHGDSNQATLQRSGEQDIVAPSPTALTKYLFGWEWPVSELRFWVRGIPSPGSTTDQTLTYNENGALATLTQSGWQLEFSKYQYADGWLLPGKITGSSDNHSFTLLIKAWQPAVSSDVQP